MPAKLYFDQCVVSNLAKQAPRWQETRIGKLLVSATAKGTAEVWASPMHVMETFLCADFDERQRVADTPKLDLRLQIARTHLELIEAKRMAPSFEFIVIEHFLRALADLAPGSVYGMDVYDWLRRENQQVYLGLLATLAAYRNLDRPEALHDLLRHKLSTRLLHSRFAKSPGDYLDDLIKAAREFRVTREDIWQDVDRRSLSELQTEIDANLAARPKLDSRLIQRLQRHTQEIADSYGAPEIGECLGSVFQLPLFLLLTFDVSKVREHWPAIVGADRPPPRFLAEANEEQCGTDANLVFRTLEILFKIFCRERLFLPGLLPRLVLGELALAMRQEEIPSEGLGFDCEHATMLTQVDVFVTVDGRFATLLKRAASDVAERMNHPVRVLTCSDELARFLERECGA